MNEAKHLAKNKWLLAIVVIAICCGLLFAGQIMAKAAGGNPADNGNDVAQLTASELVVVFGGADISNGIGFINNFYYLTEDDLARIADDPSTIPTSLGGSDAWVRDLPYSSYENHGTATYNYKMVTGLDLKTVATALGIETSQPVSVNILAKDDYSKSLSDAFSVDSNRYYYDNLGNEPTDDNLRSAVLAFYNNMVSTNTYPNDSIDIPTSAGTNLLTNGTFVYGQLSATDANNCNFVQNVNKVRFGSDVAAFKLYDNEGGLESSLTISDIVRLGVYETSYSYKKSGFDDIITHDLQGVPLRVLLDACNINLQEGQSLTFQIQDTGGEPLDWSRRIAYDDVDKCFVAYYAEEDGSPLTDNTALRVYCPGEFGNEVLIRNMVSAKVTGTPTPPPTGKVAGEPDEDTVFYLAVKDGSGEISYFFYSKEELAQYETTEDFRYIDHSVDKTVTAKGAPLKALLDDLEGVTITDDMIIQYAEQDGYHADTNTAINDSNYKDTVYRLTNDDEVNGNVKKAAQTMITYEIHEEYAHPNEFNVNDPEGVFKDADNNSGFLRAYRNTGFGTNLSDANSAVIKYLIGVVVSEEGNVLSGKDGFTVSSISSTNNELKVRDDIVYKGLIPGMKYAVQAPSVTNCQLAANEDKAQVVTVGSGSTDVVTFVYDEDTYFYVKNVDTGETTNYTYTDLLALGMQVPGTDSQLSYGYQKPMYLRYNGVYLRSLLQDVPGITDVKLVAEDGSKTPVNVSDLADYFVAYNNTQSKTSTNIPEFKRVTIAYADAKVIEPGSTEPIIGGPTAGDDIYTPQGQLPTTTMEAAAGVEFTTTQTVDEPTLGLLITGSNFTKDIYYTESELRDLGANGINRYFSGMKKGGIQSVIVGKGADLRTMLTDTVGIVPTSGTISLLTLSCDGATSSLNYHVNNGFTTAYYYPNIFTQSETGKTAVSPLLAFYRLDYDDVSTGDVPAPGNLPTNLNQWDSVQKAPLPMIMNGQSGVSDYNVSGFKWGITAIQSNAVDVLTVEQADGSSLSKTLAVLLNNGIDQVSVTGKSYLGIDLERLLAALKVSVADNQTITVKNDGRSSLTLDPEQLDQYLLAINRNNATKAVDRLNPLKVVDLQSGTVYNVDTLAITAKATQTIDSFKTLNNSIARQIVAYGTPESALTLPSTLTAILTGGKSVDLPVSWNCSTNYNPNRAGVYYFYPTIPSGYDYDQAALPNIVIKVQASETSYQIVSFTPLPANVARQTVEYGTPINHLTLPTTLTAQLDTGASVPLNVNWDCTTTYNPNRAGVYYFYPNIPSDYTYADTILPRITVTVLDQVDEYQIVKFDALSSSVAKQTVDYGTKENSLKLPARLTAYVADGSQVRLEVDWECETTYNAKKAGTYHFYPLISSLYTYDSDLLPTITIKVKAQEDAVYTITASAGTGGSISPKGDTEVDEGDNQKYTITANSGYEIDDLKVDGKSVGAYSSYTFKNVSEDHTIKVTFKDVSSTGTDGYWSNPYYDVSSNSYYYEAVKFVSQKGLFTGTSINTFSPDLAMTRGMMVTVLYRLEGSPSASYAGFSDVSANAWYSRAIAWANTNGIVKGVGNNLFSPNQPVTREMIAQILYGYAQYKGYSTSASGSLSGYSDAYQVSTWATRAMQWAVGNGIIGGTNSGLLAPQGSASRAEVAVMLQRFCNLFQNSTGNTVNDSGSTTDDTDDDDKDKDTSPSFIIKGDAVKTTTFTLNELKDSDDLQTVTYTGRNKENNNERQTIKAVGVALEDLLDEAKVKSSASTVKIVCSDGYTKTYDYDELLSDKYSYATSNSGKRVPTMIAIKEDGSYYSKSDGNPFRLIFGQEDWDDDDTKDFNMQYWARYVKQIIVD